MIGLYPLDDELTHIGGDEPQNASSYPSRQLPARETTGGIPYALFRFEMQSPAFDLHPSFQGSRSTNRMTITDRTTCPTGESMAGC